MNKQPTEIIHGSQMPELVRRIFEIRNPEAFPTYRRELAQWKRRGKGKQIRVEQIPHLLSDIAGFERTETFFTAMVYGQEVKVLRPEPPEFMAYSHQRYWRFGNDVLRARDDGLLAHAEYNREIRPQRVKEYAEAMVRGEWHDLLSDAIAITADGHLVNGQHRIAAAEDAWGGVYRNANDRRRRLYPPNDPAFLIIWGVDPSEALYADGSRRTQKDERTIAEKLMTGKEIDATASPE